MRRTVTLDPDVDALLRAAMKDRGVSLSRVLNDAVRTGLARRRFRQRTFPMGVIQSFAWDKALNVATEMEDEGIFSKLLDPQT